MLPPPFLLIGLTGLIGLMQIRHECQVDCHAGPASRSGLTNSVSLGLGMDLSLEMCIQWKTFLMYAWTYIATSRGDYCSKLIQTWYISQH